MLLDPDPIIALLREQNDRDLALLAVVAMACGDDEDAWTAAAVRIEQAVAVVQREYDETDKRRMSRRTKELHEDVLRVAPRVARALRQVGGYEAPVEGAAARGRRRQAERRAARG